MRWERKKEINFVSFLPCEKERMEKQEVSRTSKTTARVRARVYIRRCVCDGQRNKDTQQEPALSLIFLRVFYVSWSHFSLPSLDKPAYLLPKTESFILACACRRLLEVFPERTYS